jgi:septal ring factor EnvC (AmiA/AmiB activator)
MTARLSRQREAEIDGRAAHLYEYSTSYSAEWDELAGEDVPALLAELAAVRAERDEARAALRKACDHVAESEDEIGQLSAERGAAQAEAGRRKAQIAFLLEQIQKKGARSGEADAALRQFLSDDEGATS